MTFDEQVMQCEFEKAERMLKRAEKLIKRAKIQALNAAVRGTSGQIEEVVKQ